MSLQYNNKPVFELVPAATISNMIGTYGVTAFGNAPLNVVIDNLNINKMILVGLKKTKSEEKKFTFFRHNPGTGSIWDETNAIT